MPKTAVRADYDWVMEVLDQEHDLRDNKVGTQTSKVGNFFPPSPGFTVYDFEINQSASRVRMKFSCAHEGAPYNEESDTSSHVRSRRPRIQLMRSPSPEPG